MKEIPLTQGKFAIVDDDDFIYLMQWSWCFHLQYAVRSIWRNQKRERIYMHRIILQTPAGMETDHINQNGLDNRKENLRVCTKSENAMNRKFQANNTSGYKGVTWDKNRNKWQVQIVARKNKFFVGRFTDLIEAAKAYDEKAKEIFGEFANLNFV